MDLSTFHSFGSPVECNLPSFFLSSKGKQEGKGKKQKKRGPEYSLFSEIEEREVLNCVSCVDSPGMFSIRSLESLPYLHNVLKIPYESSECSKGLILSTIMEYNFLSRSSMETDKAQLTFFSMILVLEFVGSN